jgi:hypothetical protein
MTPDKEHNGNERVFALDCGAGGRPVPHKDAEPLKM